MATNRKGRNKIAFLYLQSIDLIKNRVGTAGWRIDFYFLIVNGAIYQRLSILTRQKPPVIDGWHDGLKALQVIPFMDGGF